MIYTTPSQLLTDIVSHYSGVINPTLNHMSQGKMKTGLHEPGAALNKAVERCDPRAEVFVRIDKWMDTRLFLLHFAVVKRTCTVAGNARIGQTGWNSLGKVTDPTSAIVKWLGRHWPQPWSHCIYEFVHQEWMGQVAWGGEPIPIYVSAPVDAWFLLDYFEEDIMEQTEFDWRTLTGQDGCVHFAYLQVLPDDRTRASVRP